VTKLILYTAMWILWLFVAPVMLMLMDGWNGRPLPVGIPWENGPWAVAGFIVFFIFIYLLPIILIALHWRDYRRAVRAEQTDSVH
jgi:hypothetical protein